MRMPEAIKKLPSINGGVHCEAIRDDVFRNPIGFWQKNFQNGTKEQIGMDLGPDVS
jgi:hypothetical protein